MFKVILSTLVILVIYFNTTQARKGYGPGEQDWGIINIRPGAHMFYWLHYTTATAGNYTEYPLVIWLQGGPGQSSTGIGNFAEIGPLDMNGNARNITWLTNANVLYIDSPVGSGFSYVDDNDIGYLATTYQHMANDLLIFIKAFYKIHMHFEHVPLHIFGESYGAKVAARFALNLHYAIEKQKISCNLKSVVLVSPGISIRESAMVYAPYLLHLGMIDTAGYEKILNLTKRVKTLIEARKWSASLDLWTDALLLELNQAGWFDINNVLTPMSIPADGYVGNNLITVQLKKLMQGDVSKNLSIPTNIQWGSQYKLTHEHSGNDVMIPAIHVVSQILEKTQLQVSVIAGQLDCVTPLAGTHNWINKMKWSYKNEYLAAPKKIIYLDNIGEGYVKNARNFYVYSIRRAGHMIAADNPKAMKYIFNKIITSL